MRTIKEWLSEIDKADNEHNPRRRADLADALVVELRGIFGTDDRLTEICNAERDGRLVVLPCKKGDTVYAKTSFFSKNVTEIKALAVRFNGFEYKVTCEGIGDLTFGKTVFLTKESAEKALSKGELK